MIQPPITPRMARQERTYTRDALIAEGFPLTTIRWYQRIGLLPKANGGRGKNASYSDLHLSILREIKRSKDENRSLSDLKDWREIRFPHTAEKNS
jgi:DNA-binding transcriptional MerR regulator